MKIMVYGTLKKAYGNHRIIKGSTFLGNAVTKGKYVLYDCGFPMAVIPKGETEYPVLPIMGEVYEVDEEAANRCDRLEGHPNWYCRKQINVDMNGEEVSVWMYEMISEPRATRLSNISNGIYNWLG